MRDPNSRYLYLYKEPSKNFSGETEPLTTSIPTLIDKVPFDEVEPISNTTFLALMQDAFQQGSKGFILGRMQTRDRIQYNKCFYHCFYATNLTKLLFKMPMLFGGPPAGDGQPPVADEPLISRYHQKMPLTVRNPLNNEIIVGEVEFYLLKKESLPAQ
jgi:hypothetical protein